MLTLMQRCISWCKFSQWQARKSSNLPKVITLLCKNLFIKIQWEFACNSGDENKTLNIFQFTFQHMGSREGVAAKIDADTTQKIEKMNIDIQSNKNPIIQDVLRLCYDIKPEVHKNFLLRMKN